MADGMPPPSAARTASPRAGHIAIIGGGWYGCHIAAVLRDRGIAVTLFDGNERLFEGASGRNQNRLHLGFHYPRSAVTRNQSREGFQRFVDTYPNLSEPVAENLFAVAERDSLIDFDSYCAVMDGARLDYERVDPEAFGLTGVTGALLCHERLILTDRARDHFAATLAPVLRLGHRVREVVPAGRGVDVDGERFDAAVLCTWATFAPPPAWAIYYEPCLSLVYRGEPGHPAITVMDGAFCSVFPYAADRFTLTSVRHTPLAQAATADEARAILQDLPPAEVERRRIAMEAEIERFYPAFAASFAFEGYQTSIKSKIRDSSDARPMMVHAEGAILHVFAGKIDAVFAAADEVLAWLDGS